jgi:putative endonuclease
MLRCGDGSLYTGIATDVVRRITEHETGGKGAKYLRGRGPLELIYERQVGDRSLAARVEYRVKRLPKECKEDSAQLAGRVEELIRKVSTG